MNEILDHPIQLGESRLTNKGCDICFDHVGFAYIRERTVLKDVSFTARQGEVTALVGAVRRRPRPRYPGWPPVSGI